MNKKLLACFIVFKIHCMELPKDTALTALEDLKNNAAFYIPEDLMLHKEDLFNSLRQEGFVVTPISATANLKQALRYLFKKKIVYRVHHAQLRETYKKIEVD